MILRARWPADVFLKSYLTARSARARSLVRSGPGSSESFRHSEQKTNRYRKQTTQQEKGNRSTKGGRPGIRHLRLPAAKKNTEQNTAGGQGEARSPRNRTGSRQPQGRFQRGASGGPGKTIQMVRRRRSRPCFQDAGRGRILKSAARQPQSMWHGRDCPQGRKYLRHADADTAQEGSRACNPASLLQHLYDILQGTPMTGVPFWRV